MACLPPSVSTLPSVVFHDLLKSHQLTDFYHILFTTLNLSLLLPLLLFSWGLCHIQ